MHAGMDMEKQMIATEASPEPMDVLSNEWCSYAIQVFQPKLEDCLVKTMDKSIVAIKDTGRAPSLRGDHNLNVDDDDVSGSPPWNFDDLKSWIWIQKALHPELDYDLCLRKKWFSRKITHWNGINIKKWMKELKRRRKEEERLQNAEVHAAVSVAGVAVALAAVAAQNSAPRCINGSSPHQQQQQQPMDPLRENAIASAAALVAAQCVQVAEAVGAKKEQIASAINSSVAATDANNILTLTAAAATSLRGAAALRSRPCRTASISPRACKDFDFDYSRSKASLAKGDEILVSTPDGKCRLRSVSAILNRQGKIILKIKKTNMLMAFSSANESIVYDLDTRMNSQSATEKQEREQEPFSIKITTSKGKIKLKIYDHVLYKKWVTTINHMLTLSKTFRGYELESCEN